MSTPLQDKLLAQAQVFAPLTALLGTAPFRWYFLRLQQGSQLPAIVTQVISEVPDYSFTARQALVKKRVQFTIWGGKDAPGRAAAANVEAALAQFLDVGGFDATGTGNTGVTRNYLTLARDALYPGADPPIYQRLNDWFIWDNELLP